MSHPSKGRARPHCRGIRPNVWLVGPDVELHEKYRAWLQQRNQAQWRDEPWDLPFKVWCAVWGDAWHNRGRQRGCMCMTRQDWTEPWCESNVTIITREQHARAQGQARAAGVRSARQQARRATHNI